MHGLALDPDAGPEPSAVLQDMLIICLEEDSRMLSHRNTGGRRDEASAAFSESAISDIESR